MGWLLLSCHFRLSGRRHCYLPLFISRLLNYILINNALPTALLPGQLIYHSTGGRRQAGGGFSSSSGKPSNHRICHLDSTRRPEGSALAAIAKAPNEGRLKNRASLRHLPLATGFTSGV